MNARAIVFDLFGTVVSRFSGQDVLVAMARTLQLDSNEFVKQWKQLWSERMLGYLCSVEEIVQYICFTVRHPVGSEAIYTAARLRLSYIEGQLVPSPSVLQVLSKLKAMGYLVGLISNCSCEVPIAWPTSKLAPLVDVPVFSCKEGLVKPQPAIYMLACRRLGLQAEQCLFVGDGSSQELDGAIKAGMAALLLDNQVQPSEKLPPKDVLTWQGPRIGNLEELLTICQG